MAFGEAIRIKTRHELEAMRVAGRHVAEILLELRELAKPGVTTGELDEHARRAIRRRGVESSFLGYGPHGLPPYPAVLCVSVNEEVVHGIPGRRELKEGDVLSLDFGVSFEGYHGDSAVTVPVGRLGAEAQRLVDATRRALDEGIGQMRAGHRLSDIGHAVQAHAEGEGFSVVRQFVGHGIGREMHEPPQIPNYGPAGRGPRLKPGMVFAIEPMVTAGGPDVRMLDDEWTAVTADGSLAAHFEHTILVTEAGPEVLTRVPGSH
ncbi:MAG: type I methionyl aminopeptidase [Deltaproteobacteria bacterium]|nr:type I methionyl aminopeptidase [Deltaproteobacteria bacterium]